MAPLISINIPTLNSAVTVGDALRSVRNQNRKDLEIVVIDGGSEDATVGLAREFRAQVETCAGSLLEARVQGIRASAGEFVLLLDSDQFLRPDALERCLRLVPTADMITLGEGGYSPHTWISRLYALRREATQRSRIRYLHPKSGLLLPRFFRTDLLRRAADRIPGELMSAVSDRDHQILFWETWKETRRVAFLEDAVLHRDPDRFQELVSRNWRWGSGAGRLSASGRYPELFESSPWLILPPKGSALSLQTLRLYLAANLLGVLKLPVYGAAALSRRTSPPGAGSGHRGS